MTTARIGVSARTRWLTLAGVAVLHLVAIAVLIAGLGVEAVVTSARSVAAFDVSVAPPPEPERKAPEPQGRAAPPAPRATPKPAPPKPPVVIRPKPAPTASASGTAPPSGAREAGAGSGGGQGSGTGIGGRGSGAGGGLSRDAVKVSGELKTKDFPKSGVDQRDGKFIIVRYTVGTDGRVGNCRVVQSSGSAEADAITCRLIEKRFRYRPALDGQGNPVPRETGWKQWWWRPA